MHLLENNTVHIQGGMTPGGWNGFTGYDIVRKKYGIDNNNFTIDVNYSKKSNEKNADIIVKQNEVQVASTKGDYSWIDNTDVSVVTTDNSITFSLNPTLGFKKSLTIPFDTPQGNNGGAAAKRNSWTPTSKKIHLKDGRSRSLYRNPAFPGSSASSASS